MDVNTMAIVILLGSFFLMVFLRFPIAYAVALSSVFCLMSMGKNLTTVCQQMVKGISSFSLMAVPFFITMGCLMGSGGISEKLIALANACVGWMRGGMAMVNIVASYFFGGISGSAAADTASLGSILIPMMVDQGYDDDFSTAVTITSSCEGLLVPPSHNMVLYSMVAGGVSVGSLFCAGYIPGIMLGVFIMGMCYIISKKKHYPKGKKLPFKEALRVTKDTFFAMLAMVIIIGGVSAGFFTATESAAVACIYCLFVGFFIYRELRFKDIPVVLGNTIKTLSMVYALIAAAGAFGWVMAYLNVPTLATNLLLGISDNKIVVLLLINLILLLLGCVMDLAPLVLIMAPILLPVVTKFGMSPIQFGVMMMLNLGIGLCTPPVGTALFTGCAIGNMKIEKVSKAMLPLYIPMLITLLLVTFIPALTMTLPELIMK